MSNVPALAEPLVPPSLAMALISALWRRKWLISFMALLGLLLGIGFLHHATYRYTAELKLTPAQTSGDSLSAKLGGLGDVASLAGVNLGQDKGSRAYALYLESVYSRETAENLARQPALMTRLFPAEWDAARGEWVEPLSPRRQFMRNVKRALGIPLLPWRAPDGARLQKYIQKSLRLEQSPRKPVAGLSFDHADPHFAIQFLTALHKVIDDRLRRQELARANAYIAYLSKQLVSTTIAEHREALSRALSEQEKSRMTASTSLPFAAEPFEGPYTSAGPTNPNPLKVLVLSLLCGGFSGLILALALALRRQEFAPRPAMERRPVHRRDRAPASRQSPSAP